VHRMQLRVAKPNIRGRAYQELFSGSRVSLMRPDCGVQQQVSATSAVQHRLSLHTMAASAPKPKASEDKRASAVKREATLTKAGLDESSLVLCQIRVFLCSSVRPASPRIARLICVSIGWVSQSVQCICVSVCVRE
jgi:hypothetical protein